MAWGGRLPAGVAGWAGDLSWLLVSDVTLRGLVPGFSVWCVSVPRAGEAGERVDHFEQQGVDAGLLVGGAAGAEFGDGAAVVGLGGEWRTRAAIAGLVRDGGPALPGWVWPGGAGRSGGGMVSPG